MFLNRWNSPRAWDAGGIGPNPLPFSHSSSTIQFTKRREGFKKTAFITFMATPKQNNIDLLIPANEGFENFLLTGRLTLMGLWLVWYLQATFLLPPLPNLELYYHHPMSICMELQHPGYCRFYYRILLRSSTLRSRWKLPVHSSDCFHCFRILHQHIVIT